MSKRREDLEWKEVCPGLWELKNTPKSVRISRDTAEIYRQTARKNPSPLSKRVELMLEQEAK